MNGGPTMNQPGAGPFLRVVAGSPDTAEVAVITAVLSAVASAPAPQGPADVLDQWTDRARNLRTRPAPGPVTWRGHGLPRVW